MHLCSTFCKIYIEDNLLLLASVGYLLAGEMVSRFGCSEDVDCTLERKSFGFFLVFVVLPHTNSTVASAIVKAEVVAVQCRIFSILLNIVSISFSMLFNIFSISSYIECITHILFSVLSILSILLSILILLLSI